LQKEKFKFLSIFYAIARELLFPVKRSKKLLFAQKEKVSERIGKIGRKMLRSTMRARVWQ
jgi:hypothetical protein